MSKFSDLLSTYIEEKEVKVYPLAHHCKVDRSAMYRFIRGTRNPSDLSTVQMIADYLKLSPQQRAEFCEAWEIIDTGEELWYQRRAIEHFLLTLPGSSSKHSGHLWSSSEDSFPASKNTILLKTKEELRAFLETMLVRESAAEKPELMLLLQPEHTEFADFLLSDPRSKDFDICHILCLNNHAPSAAQSISFSYNIECLENLMPLYVSRPGFHTRYYYDDVAMHFHSVSLMPCMILTGGSAVTCPADLSFGIAHTDPAVISMLQDIYRKYKNASHPLAIRSDWVEPEFEEQIKCHSSRDSVLFGPDPYIFSWITPDLLQKYMTGEAQQDPEVLPALSRYLSLWKEYTEASGTVWYTTRSSLEYFMATGRISSLPERLLHPFSCRDRHLYLEYLGEMAKKHSIRLVKEPLDRVQNRFHLCINSQAIFLIFPETDGVLSGLTIREPGLVNSFSDLFKSFNESAQSTQKEFYDYIKNML